MLSLFRVEHLKYKCTMTRRLMLMAPLFFIVMALPQSYFMPPDCVHSWNLVLGIVYNWWPVLFLPLGIALIAGLVVHQEKRAGGYRAALIHPISPAQLWLAKTVIMSYQLLLATVVLVGAALVSGMITKAGPVPWRKLLLGGMLLWVTSLPLIPIQLWAAEMLGFIGSMAVGTVGFAAGVWAAPAPHWIYYPWSWPIRMMCPLIGVHPNGTFLPPNDPLLNSGVIPLGLTLAVLVTIAFCLGGAFWFSRQEVLS
ncbi:MAG: lantibiotic immunity ABC transporter MutE/EpiE family permease subunit [Firmicutes bacterium]|jgi:lantibiotic protection ABC transporter MutE/EpiE family permease subunit|nr:lantibiotic immunity ABC transporter MutE/EpiE family permease subunit [Bacillota bacterium]